VGEKIETVCSGHTAVSPCAAPFSVVRISFALTILLLSAVSAHASCTSEVGAARANQYVQHCRDVSPTTRPPCNAANACSLLLAEIRRGCAFLKEDAPAYCRTYVGGTR
jgi:hypothetical protein